MRLVNGDRRQNRIDLLLKIFLQVPFLCRFELVEGADEYVLFRQGGNQLAAIQREAGVIEFAHDR